MQRQIRTKVVRRGGHGEGPSVSTATGMKPRVRWNCRAPAHTTLWTSSHSADMPAPFRTLGTEQIRNNGQHRPRSREDGNHTKPGMVLAREVSTRMGRMPDGGVGLRTVKALTSPARNTPGPHVTPATQGSGFNQVVPESCFALKERGSRQALTGGTRRSKYYTNTMPIPNILHYPTHTIPCMLYYLNSLMPGTQSTLNKCLWELMPLQQTMGNFVSSSWPLGTVR